MIISFIATIDKVKRWVWSKFPKENWTIMASSHESSRIYINSTQRACQNINDTVRLFLHYFIYVEFSIWRACKNVGIFFVKAAFDTEISHLMPSILDNFVPWIGFDQAYIVVQERSNVGSSALSHRHTLNRFPYLIWSILSHSHIIKLNCAVHWAADNIEAPNFWMGNRIFESFDCINRMIWISPVVPNFESRIIRGTHNQGIIWIKVHTIDSIVMPCIFSDRFAFNYISQNYIFVASPSHELRIVLRNRQTAHIVVVQIFVMFYHEILMGIVETDTPILTSRHAVLSRVVEFNHINRSWVHFL